MFECTNSISLKSENAVRVYWGWDVVEIIEENKMQMFDESNW